MVDQSASPPVSSLSDCDRTLEVRDKKRAQQSHAADATGELGAEDIVEVQAAVDRLVAAKAAKGMKIEGTQELSGDDILEVENAARKLEAPPPPPPPPAPPSAQVRAGAAVIVPPVRQTTKSIPPPPPPSKKAAPASIAGVAGAAKKERVPAGNAKLSDVFGTITPKKLREMEEEGVFGNVSAEAIMAPYQTAQAQDTNATPPPFAADMNQLVANMAPSAPPPPMFQPPVSQAFQPPRDPYPSSIAPIALDVAPPRPSLESTSEIVRAAGIPQRPVWQFAVGVAGAIIFSMMGVSAFGGFSHGSSHAAASVAPGAPVAPGAVADDTSVSASTSTTAASRRAATFARADEQVAAITPPSDVTPPAPTPVSFNDTPAKIDAPTEAPTVLVGGETLAPPPVQAAAHATQPSHMTAKRSRSVAASWAAPAATPQTTTQPASRATMASTTHAASTTANAKSKTVGAAASSTVKTGSLHMPAGVNGALVDGTPHKVVGGEIVLACGAHKVKLAMQSPRTVNVPCGGSAQF